ncbi:VanZ family protein [Azotobacter chroococcum]|uniref:VanZ family protein n=1 Tax=Azotobacter chroococcum TaxID=353 RepID=UPI0014051F02|nr:VanZ family protein [Azotobacter chroococcum]
MPVAHRLAHPLLLWRLAFLACLAVVLALALLKDVSPPLDTGWDKSNHLLAFGVLALLGHLGFPGRHVQVPFGLFLYGILIEVLQGLTDYRVADYRDLLADLLGIVLGSLVAAGWLRHRRRERQPGA